MAYSETRSFTIKKRASAAITLNTTTSNIVVGVPVGVTAVTAATIAGSATNVTATLDASNATVTLTATATTLAVAKDAAILLTLTQQKHYGLEDAMGIEHTVAHP